MTYVIRQTRHFYGPRSERSLATDGRGAALIFPNRKAALAWIKATEAEAYHEAHNECARPDYVAAPVSSLPKYLASGVPHTDAVIERMKGKA